MAEKDYTKWAVIQRIRQERDHFTSLLKELAPGSYKASGVVNGWSVKDVLGHVTAWEKQMLDWIEMAWRGEEPDMPAPGTWDEYIQNFNEANYQAKRDLPLDVILEEFDEIYARMLHALEEMPEDSADPFWRVWWGGKPAWGFADTYAHHYAEHREQLAAWFGKKL